MISGKGGSRCKMNQDIFAAHCLVALSHSGVQGQVDGQTMRTCQGDKPLDLSLTHQEPQQQQTSTVQGSNNLFMVARILADLNRVRQEPVPQIKPLEVQNLTLKLAPTIVSSPALQSSKIKTHRCEHEGCGKIYGKSSHLKAHLRTHTGQ